MKSTQKKPEEGFSEAAAICLEAARLVEGERGVTHGNKQDNFSKIAALWNGYWFAKHGAYSGFDAATVADLMELLKIARRLSGTFNRDDYVDAAGYAGCAGELAEKPVL